MNAHIIDWDNVKIPAKEPNWKTKGAKEAIFIKKAGLGTINWDGGHHHLPGVFSKLLYCFMMHS